jgi:hypothetical protein
MSSPSPIWYLLFNSETGKQCIGSSASYILRSSLVIPSNYPPDVDDFLKAVKAELAWPAWFDKAGEVINICVLLISMILMS